MKTKLERLIVLAVLLVASLLSRKTIADLAAYYPLNEGSGTTVNDASGNGHNGSVNREVRWINSKSGYGKALYFKGDNATGHVDCGTWNPSELTGQLSIALWIRWDGSGGNWQAPISKRNNWAADRMAWQVGLNKDSQQISFYREGSYPNCGDCVLPKGEWTHVAVTFDGTIVVFYMNGKVTGRGDFSFGSHTNASIIIGAADPGGLDTFHGALDEVYIFNNALSENDVIQLYESTGTSFLSPALIALRDDVSQAKKLISGRSSQAAIAFLEDKIVEYELWEKGNPKFVGLSSELLASDLHFFLAKAKEAADAPTSDIAEAYMKSAIMSSRSPNYVPSLLWLFGNIPANNYIEFVRKCRPKNEGAFNYIHPIAGNFEACRNWDAFKLFLDGNFAEVNDTTAFAKAIAEGLSKNGVWANKFLEYCLSKSELSQYVVGECEKWAQEHIEQGGFLKAAKIYRDLASRCTSDPDKSVYELKICECLFNSGQYLKALSELSNFINKYKVTNKVLIKPAIILKGSAYIQLGEIDQASDTFRKLMVDNPETKKTPEPNFYIGYCNMLQDKLEEAKEKLSTVVKDYPESPYASKARLCLSKIERMRR
jgi:predicted negative regulator of RcsB-dependent stress response